MGHIAPPRNSSVQKAYLRKTILNLIKREKYYLFFNKLSLFVKSRIPFTMFGLN